MEYQLKNDHVEAWQIGTEPIPSWAADMLTDGTITNVGGVFSVSTAVDRERAEAGDYVTYQPTVWGEPTEQFPQGEVLAIREVKLIKRADFEARYETQPSAAEPAEPEKPKRKK